MLLLLLLLLVRRKESPDTDAADSGCSKGSVSCGAGKRSDDCGCPLMAVPLVNVRVCVVVAAAAAAALGVAGVGVDVENPVSNVFLHLS